MVRLNNAGVGCFGVFVFFICAVVAFFDAMTAKQLLDQHNARTTYTQTQGEVVRAEVKRFQSGSTRQGASTSYKAIIEYQYDVGGAQYTSDRYSFIEIMHGDPSIAQQIVDRYNPGDTVTIHYDPDDPSRSVLDLSFDAFAHMTVLFMIPFHCFAAMLLRFWLIAWCNKGKDEEDFAVAPLIAAESESALILRDQSWSAILIGIIALGVSTFAMTFALLIAHGGFTASAIVVYSSTGLCTLFALAMMLRAWVTKTRGNRRLIIDYKSSTFERLDNPGPHPIMSIKSIKVESRPRATKKSSPKNREAWYEHDYFAVLDSKERVKLVRSWGHKDTRRTVKRWLERKVALRDVS